MKEHFDIGAAIFEMRQGRRVAREGWNGKGMWLELQVPDEFSKMTRPYVFLNYPPVLEAMKVERVPWLASMTDLLADDWFVVEPEERLVQGPLPALKKLSAMVKSRNRRNAERKARRQQQQRSRKRNRR